MKPMVSILIVTYNSEKYIGHTLQSCLDQTYNDIEILILDNASSDNTIKIIESNSDKRIKLLKSSENIGPYVGLNLLMKAATGSYIAIQDHDDIWFPKKIEKQIEFLEKESEFVACGTNVYYFFEGKQLFILKEFEEVSEYVNHTSLVFRKMDVSYNNDVVFPEEDFERRVIGKYGKIYCVQEGLTIHRIRADKNNLSRKRFRLNFKNIEDIIRTNKIRMSTLMYILYLCVNSIVPEKIIWFVRLNITMKNNKKVTEGSFREMFPKIKF